MYSILHDFDFWFAYAFIQSTEHISNLCNVTGQIVQCSSCQGLGFLTLLSGAFHPSPKFTLPQNKIVKNSQKYIAEPSGFTTNRVLK